MSLLLTQPAEVALLAIASIDADGDPSDFVVLRVASIAENYVDSLLQTLTAEYLLGDSLFETAIERLAHERLHQNWPARRHWLRESFGISTDGQLDNQDFFLLIDLRNALVHGMGTLTRQQRGRLNEQLELESKLRLRLLVRVDGYRVATTAETAKKAVDLGSRFIKAVDAQSYPVLQRRSLT